MSENTMPEQEPNLGTTELEEGIKEPGDAPKPAIEGMLNKEQLAALRERVAKFAQGSGKTVSNSEMPDQVPTHTPEGNPVGPVMTGRDVDWSEYDLDFNFRHFYPRAVFRETPQGPKWVAMLDEFYTTTRSGRSHGKRVNKTGANDKTETEPLNLGEWLNETVNGPEGWKIGALVPAGSTGDICVLLQRQTPLILPDPQPLKRETEVEAPTDPELQQAEDAAIGFMEKEGLTPEAPVEDDTRGEAAADFKRRIVDPEYVVTEESGALPARDLGGAVRTALDLNAGMTQPVVQPDRVDPTDITDVLNGPDFGDVNCPSA